MKIRNLLLIHLLLIITACKTSSSNRRDEEGPFPEAFEAEGDSTIQTVGTPSAQFELVSLETLAQSGLKKFTKRWFTAPHRTQVSGAKSWEDRHIKSSEVSHVVLRSYQGSSSDKNAFRVIQTDGSGNFIANISDNQLEKILKENKIEFDKKAEIASLIRQNYMDSHNYARQDELDNLGFGRIGCISFDSRGKYLGSSSSVDGFTPHREHGVILASSAKNASAVAEKIKLYRPDALTDIVELRVSGRDVHAVVLMENRQNFFNEMIRAKEKESKKILSAIQETFTQNSKLEPYGGVPGREYFRQRYNLVVEPTMIASLERLKTMGGNVGEVPLFRNLLYELGQERQKIAAVVSIGSGSENMGSMTRTGTQMVDPINESSFPAWRTNLEHRIAEALPSETNLSEFDQKLAQIFSGAKVSKEAELLPALAARYGVKKGDLNVFTIGGSMENSEKFGELIIALPTKKEAIRVSDLLLIMQHKVKMEDSLDKLAPDFYRALNASQDDLEEALGMLLLRLSHASIFERGQAAITVWLLQGIARTHGFNLTFSKNWQGPNFPNPDMRALSSFDDAQFLAKFKQNVTLAPVPPEH